MSSQPSANGVFATSRLLPFTPEQVFAGISDPSRLAAWWGPDGFKNTFEVFEFRPQGHWRFVMHGPDGTDYPNDSVFLETSPSKVIIKHVSPPHFTLTVTLAESGGQTMLSWRQAFDDPQVAAGLGHIIEPANEQNLNRLHKVLSAGK